jgi:Straboviridae tail tube protein Gp19
MITFTAPTAISEVVGSATSELSYQAKGAEIPASTLGIVEVGYFGRKIKVAGDRSFADWTVNVMCDEDMVSRSFFEAWSDGINTMESNVRETSAVNESPGSGNIQAGYKVDQQITQYGKDGTVLRSYTMVGAWPAEVGAIQLDWDNQNQIITFPVRFAYDFWLPVIETGRGGAISSYAAAANSAQNSTNP